MKVGVGHAGGNQFVDYSDVLSVADVAVGARVADLGCGAAGYFVFPFAQAVGEQGTVYAVDVRRSVLDGIKHRARVDGLPQIETVWANLELPQGSGLSGKSLDVALLINVLFQNNDRQALLTEAIRLLRVGGRLIVIDWKTSQSPLGPSADRRVDQVAVSTFCERHGLVQVQSFTPGDYHFGLVFEKKK